MTGEYSKHIVWFTFLVIIFYCISLFMPTNVKVTHQEEIYGDVDVVYHQFYDISNWKNWCVWNNEDQKSLVIYDEKTLGPGASFRWKHGKKYNSDGKIEILNANKNQNIEFYIKASSIDSIFTYVNFNKKDNGVEVEWISDLELNNSASRLMGFFLKRWLIRDIKKSLRNINTYLLQNNEHNGWISDEYLISESHKTSCLFILDTVINEEFQNSLLKNYEYLTHKADTQYHAHSKFFFYQKVSTFSNDKHVYKFSVTLDKDIEPSDEIDIYHQKALMMRYFGSNKGIKKVVKKAQEIARKNRISIDANPIINFNQFPIDFDQLDTNVMNINFIIR